MRNPSPEIKSGVAREVVRAVKEKTQGNRASGEQGAERAHSADPFHTHDVHGSSLVAEAFVSGAISAEERAFLAARPRDGSIPDLPQLVKTSEGNAGLSLEPTRRTAYSITEQRNRVVAARKGEGVKNSNAEAADISSTEARRERARAQAIVYENAAEEANDPTERKMWEDKANRARQGILAEDGDVDVATIEKMRLERKAARDAIAAEEAYDNASMLGKLMMRLRGKGR